MSLLGCRESVGVSCGSDMTDRELKTVVRQFEIVETDQPRYYDI